MLLQVRPVPSGANPSRQARTGKGEFFQWLCQTSPCASCLRPAFISATAPSAGTRKWRRISTARSNDIHIIDLTQTVPLLHQALLALRETVAGGGRILFVGTKRQASEPIAAAAKRCAQYYRQSPLARRHADQLADDLQFDPALAQHRGNAGLGAEFGPHQEGIARTPARARQARTLAGRHQGNGRPAEHAVRDRHQQGSHRHRRGAQARHPRHRDPGFELQSRRHCLSVPGNDDAARALALYCDLAARAIIDGLSAGQVGAGHRYRRSRGPCPISHLLWKQSPKPRLPPNYSDDGARHGQYHRQHGEGPARQDRRGHDGLQGGTHRNRWQSRSRNRLAAQEGPRQGGEEGRARCRRRPDRRGGRRRYGRARRGQFRNRLRRAQRRLQGLRQACGGAGAGGRRRRRKDSCKAG